VRPQDRRSGDFELYLGGRDDDIANRTYFSGSMPSPSLTRHRKERATDKAVADGLAKVVTRGASNSPRSIQQPTAHGYQTARFIQQDEVLLVERLRPRQSRIGEVEPIPDGADRWLAHDDPRRYTLGVGDQAIHRGLGAQERQPYKAGVRATGVCAQAAMGARSIGYVR